MKIAIVGNRSGWKKEFVLNKLSTYNITSADIIISGGAEGVDSYAQEFARRTGCQMRILYPDPKKASPQRYFDRNEQIAIMCDKMIAFDKPNYGSGGTRNAITNAQKLDKELIIVESEV